VDAERVAARSSLGRNGEDLAASLYRRAGYQMVERNYRVPEGEIDLIARRGSTVVFCEVKTRRTDHWGAPVEAVAWRKQARLRRLAARWMRERGAGEAEVRFDVVSVVVREGRPEITHFPDAF
jgi:putative endonuclease